MGNASRARRHLEMQAAAEPYAALALKTLVNICRVGDTDRDRLGAAKEILDRAYGKAVQGHLLTLEDNPADESIEEVATSAERFTSSIARLAARAGKDRGTRSA